MKQRLRAILTRFPRTKALLKRLRDASGLSPRISSRYVEITSNDSEGEAARLRDAWQATFLPERQRELVERQLTEFRSGVPVDVFDVMLTALHQLPEPVDGMSLLEVGCSSGYYAEVLQFGGLRLAYTGCDYAEAFIAMARQKYPGLRFDVEDAAALRYADGEFDIVISGCCLLHIPEYERAIAETARVARRYAVFHRTPVVVGQPEKRFRKLAYGVETFEIHFKEPQFLALLVRNGLAPIATYTLSESIRDGVGDAQRTYVCSRLPG